eukprot:2443048-Amphidinium_carterae.1
MEDDDEVLPNKGKHAMTMRYHAPDQHRVLATIFYLLEEACDIGDGIVVALFRILERMGLTSWQCQTGGMCDEVDAIEVHQMRLHFALSGVDSGHRELCSGRGGQELHFFNAAVIVGVGAVILSLTQVMLCALTRVAHCQVIFTCVRVQCIAASHFGANSIPQEL